MVGESIFETRDPRVRQRQALDLLNDYSHPWDVLAESLQNAVDAINRKYRELVAQALGISRDQLESAIGTAADSVITADKAVHDGNYDQWASDEYWDGSRGRWFAALARELKLTEVKVRTSFETRQKTYAGKIEIQRTVNSRSIEVKDNGVGMSLASLKEAVKKGVTDKGGYSEIGQMGNGLTYLVAACDDFRMESSDGQELSTLAIAGMYSWITGSGPGVANEPLSEPKSGPTTGDTFTRVQLKDIRRVDSDFPDLFDKSMTTQRLVHLIRTKTAVGALHDTLRFPVFDGLRGGSISVQLTDVSGTVQPVVNIPFEFETPGAVVRRMHAGASPPILSLSQAKANIAMHIDIGGNSIERIGMKQSSTGRTLYYYSFLSTREWFREVSRAAGLCDTPSATDIRKIGWYDVIPCIELGVKGMPTGVVVDPPVTGFQGYWGNFRIIILDNDLEFDEGRKTPVGRRVTLYRDCAEHVLFTEVGTEVIGKAIKDAVVPMSLSQMATSHKSFADKRLKSRKSLNYPAVKVGNIPEYEQDVFALFHEMIAGGVLPYYELLDSSSNSQYDAIYRYSIPKAKLGVTVQQVQGQSGTFSETIITEFKHTGQDLILDVAANVKFYYMMDLLVCWTIDSKACARLSATLIKKPAAMVQYWGTTHELRLSPANFMNVGNGRALDVICLEDLIDQLRKGTYKVP